LVLESEKAMDLPLCWEMAMALGKAMDLLGLGLAMGSGKAMDLPLCWELATVSGKALDLLGSGSAMESGKAMDSVLGLAKILKQKCTPRPSTCRR